MRKEYLDRLTWTEIPTPGKKKKDKTKQKMNKKLDEIFVFLKNNRKYNKELQTRYYKSIIEPQKDTFEKLISLLYNIANTQSQPNINKLANFYKKIYENKSLAETFTGFLKIIKSENKENNLDYKTLYKGMKNQDGWGEKTSALFAKTIYHIHNNEYPKELKIWNDVPNRLNENDKFYLPVDAVITSIFKRIDGNTKWSFSKINKEIDNYKGKDIEIWDDLWFWGFITQKGTGDNRKMKWNINKYWNLRESDKNNEMIIEIEQKAGEFLKILNE